jgi:hypothetical protein
VFIKNTIIIKIIKIIVFIINKWVIKVSIIITNKNTTHNMDKINLDMFKINNLTNNMIIMVTIINMIVNTNKNSMDQLMLGATKKHSIKIKSEFLIILFIF